MILNPSVGGCPECGESRLNGDRLVTSSISFEQDGGIEWIDSNEEGICLYSLRCESCNTQLIENGRIVHDAVTGKRV